MKSILVCIAIGLAAAGNAQIVREVIAVPSNNFPGEFLDSVVEYELEGEVPYNEFTQGMTYERLSINERKPVPYRSQREADVMYALQLERIMDTREKQNLICNWPKNSLVNVIFDAAERGQIKAYTNDSMTSYFTADTVKTMLGEKINTEVESRDYPGEFVVCPIWNPMPLEDIVKWKIKEEWIFDKQSGQFQPRIVAIAPIYTLTVDGVDLGEYEAFYVDWNEVRNVLIKEETFNRHNDGARLSYYDFFEQRLFTSYVTKEPNVFDDPYAHYAEWQDNPLGPQIESQKKKEELMNWESDLWQY